MSKKKVVTERFINNGVIVNEETGEINKPESNDYEITLRQFFEDDTPEGERLMDLC